MPFLYSFILWLFDQEISELTVSVMHRVWKTDV